MPAPMGPPAPKGSAAPAAAAPPPAKYTYGHFAEAVRLAYPGQFDDEDPSALVDSVLEVYPQFKDQLDHTTKGMEGLPPEDGGPRRSDQFVKGKNGWTLKTAKPGAPQPITPTGEAIAGPRTLKDDAIATGYRLGGGVAGVAAAGATAVATGGVGAWAAPTFLLAGGMAGEAAAEQYEMGEGYRDRMSIPNMVSQGAVNMIPVAGAAESALARTGASLAARGAPRLGATIAEGILPRTLGSAAEGAVQGAAGASMDVITGEGRAPTLGEVATNAGLGAVMGAGFHGFGEVKAHVRTLRAQKLVRGADAGIQALGAQYLDPEARAAAMAPVIEALEQASKLDPTAAKPGYEKLMTILDAHTQQDLQLRAASYLSSFAQRAPGMEVHQRVQEAKDFLAGLKEANLTGDAFDQVVRTVAGVTEVSAQMDAARAPRQLTAGDPAEYERVQSLGRGDVEPVGAPRYVGPGGVGGPPKPYSPEASGEPRQISEEARLAALAPNTLAAPKLAGQGRLAPPPEPPPPVADWRGARNRDELEAEWAAERAAKQAADTAALAGAQSTPLPMAAPKFTLGKPAASLVEKPPVGVDTLPVVQAGQLDRTHAALLQWVRKDMDEFGFEQAVGQDVTNRAHEKFDGVSAFEKNRAFARVPGTRLARTIAKIAGVVPEQMKRGALKEQIDAVLAGTSRGGKLAQAAVKYVQLLDKAWDGQAFDWGRLDPDALKKLGIRQSDLHQPMLSAGMAFPEDEADDLIKRFAPERHAERQGLIDEMLTDTPLSVAPRVAIPEAAELHLGGLNNRELRELYEDLHAQGEPGMQMRGWVAQALHDRGIASPAQQSLIDQDLTAHAPAPSEAIFALENAAAQVPEAAAAPSPLDLLGDETGAVGKVNRLRIANAKKAEALGGGRAPGDLSLDTDTYRQLQKAVEEGGEAETAGLLLGTADGKVARVMISRNTAPDPTTAFEISGETLATAQRVARANGLEVLGSFHSQPTGSAQPSRRDLLGGVADLPMLIVGSTGGQVRDIGVFQPQGKARFQEGQLTLHDQPTAAPGSQLGAQGKTAVKSLIAKVPKFRGAPNDEGALRTYMSTHGAELSTEPFYAKAEAALEAGNPAQAWMELQIGQVIYSKAAGAASVALGGKDGANLSQAVRRLDAGSAQDPAGHLWALYGGRTTYVEGVGRVVVAPMLPGRLQDLGVTAGPGGILHPPAAEAGVMPGRAVRENLTLKVVNRILQDADPDLVLDDPTKVSATRAFRQISEQIMRSPSTFRALADTGASEAQVAAHLRDTVSESAKILAAIGVWKRQHKEAITRIEGIQGSSGALDDLLIIGKGRKVGRLGDLTTGHTFDALVNPANSWEKVMLIHALSKGEVGRFDQAGRASRGFMLSQVSTAVRNVYSVTGRWGTEVTDAAFTSLGHAIAGDGAAAKYSFRRAVDLVKLAPIAHPSGWMTPWRGRQSEWQQLFDFSTGLAKYTPKERQQVIHLIASSPEHAADFLGGMAFGAGESDKVGTSKSALLNWAASPAVQHTLTMFNRAQEYSIRGAMLEVSLRDQLRQAGLDPTQALALHPDALRHQLGEDKWTQILDHAVGESLDFTFSGGLIRKGFGRDSAGKPVGGVNAKLIDIVNSVPILREGYPFPKFNLSAGPRYLWDHSGIGMLVEPIYALTGRGRYHLGTQAKSLREVQIPEATRKMVAARAEMTEALQGYTSIKGEIAARQRLAKRFDALPTSQGMLPEMVSKRQENFTRLESLQMASKAAFDKYQAADTTVKDFEAQKQTLDDLVAQAAEANVPETFAELAGRNLSGLAVLLPAAAMIRADQREKGTKWYQIKFGEGDDAFVLDTRPLAPFTQYLFVADVLQDFYDNTDWGGVMQDLDLGKYRYDNIGEAFFTGGRYDGEHSADDIAKGLVGMLGTILDDGLSLPGDLYKHYEGKYTAKSLGSEIANALVSTSQVAGTTLSAIDLLTDIGQTGLPSVPQTVNVAANVIGQFLARFTIPFAQFKALSDLADDDESHARIADTGEDFSWTGTAQPLGNIPFLGSAVIPDTYNQLTGQPLDTYRPQLRALSGVTLQRWNRVVGAVNDTGLTGPQTHIRTTGDYYLDRLVATHYAQLVQQHIPEVLDSEEYQFLDSPATKRDALAGVFKDLKQAALGLAAADAGADRVQAARKGSEAIRAETRGDRLRRKADEQLRRVLKEEGIAEGNPNEQEPPADLEPIAPEEPDEPEPEPETPGTGAGA